jgi:aldehyde dehydrogenase (NAD+)
VKTDTRFYIDGQWTDRPQAPLIPVHNPYTEEAFGQIAAGSAADVDLAVAAANRAFASFARTTVAERVALLTRIRDLLEERSEEFAQAIAAEMGAAITFARGGQVHFGIEHVRVVLKVLEDYAFETQVNGIHVRREPIGVCALITP